MRFFPSRRNWGMLLLAVWLLATAAVHFLPNWSSPRVGDVLAALALAAGVLILLGR